MTFRSRPIKLNPPPDEDIVADADVITEGWRRASVDDFSTFCRGLLIATARGPACFENVMADHQRDAFGDVAESLQAIRDGRQPLRRRFWWERTKKSGKDSDLACVVLWLAAFPRRPFYGQVGAADRGQAEIVRDRVSALLYHNPWLNEHVEVVQREIRSKARGPDGTPLARIDIMAADVPGSHGGTPDILILNELSHVQKWKFFENLMSNADGVPNGIVIIATNAGIRGTPAEVWRNNAIKSPDWDVRVFPMPAPWHDKASLKDARNRLRTAEYRRLWQGLWISGVGNALDEEAIARTFNNNLRALSGPEPGWFYLGGLDLGVSHDHSGLVVLGINEDEGKIRVAWFRAYEPDTMTAEGKKQVDLQLVEDDVVKIHKAFDLCWMGYDPAAGGSFMAQRLQRRGVPMAEMTVSSPRNRIHMAEAFIAAVEAGVLECYDDPDGRLRRDFGKFDIMNTTGGIRLVAVSDEHGHADVGTALVICLPRARELLGGFGSLRPGDDVAMPLDVDDERELTAEEREALPPELADIYDAYDEIEADEKRGYGRDDFSDVF